MRALTIMSAAFALITISCSQNEVTEVDTTAKEIKFTNLNDRIPSKAANDSISDYGVYANLVNATPAATAWFMDNQKIDGVNNSYSPAKFWPNVGTLSFYSYAPYNSANLDRTNVKWDATTPTFDITYTVPAGANEDFTIAAPRTGLSSGEVLLEFSHMLSKISFTTQLETALVNEGFALTLNSVTLKVANNQGNNSLAAPSAWTNLVASASNAPYANGTEYMIMPQPANGTEITLNVTVTYNGATHFTGELTPYLIQNQPGLTDFTKGMNYVFAFTIGDTATGGGGDKVFNVILFDADIAPWASGTIPVV